jgi:hypothetical protein
LAYDALAVMLGTAAVRTDYGRRRHALRSWVISPGQWSQRGVSQSLVYTSAYKYQR